jgi:hypothetical protein
MYWGSDAWVMEGRATVRDWKVAVAALLSFSAIRECGKNDPLAPPRATTEPRTPPQRVAMMLPAWNLLVHIHRYHAPSSTCLVLLLSLSTLLGPQRASLSLPKRVPLHAISPWR